MKTRSLSVRLAVPAVLLALAAACTDQPLAPVPAAKAPPGAAGSLQCSVHVREGTLSCTEPKRTPPGGASFDRIVGGPEVYVRLAGSGASYDGGTQQFQISVTVQNLAQHAMGTQDGVTVQGLRVFFNSGPTVTGGSGTASLANADGTAFFLSAAQPYFLYGEILSPYEISGGRPWVFDVSSTVTSFSFVVYVSAPMTDESGPMLDAVWDGSEGSAWETAGNWSDGTVPDSASTVSIPADSLFAGAQPVLAASTQVSHLRVGFGSTLGLGGNTLTTWGNVDAIGAVQGGTLHLGGTGVVVGGSLPSVRLTGSATLQKSVTTTGAVSIADGALSVADLPLSIQVP